MTIRMQQRRGTASQWTSANPILNAGEIGWESDTNRFKIGDGSTTWTNLDYFIDANSTVNPSFGTSIVFEGSTANDFETTIQVTDPTADRTITFPDITGTIVTTGDTGTVTSTMIANNTIVNADISTDAAIALSKLAVDPSNRANHSGTQTASTISDFDTQVRTSKLSDMAVPNTSVSMNSQKITNLGAPSSDTDAATKEYVDAATAGLNVHEAVRVATIANIDLSTDLENGDTLDGITLATGDRVLVKNQTNKAENGIYVVQASGAAVRASDYNQAGEVDSGDYIFVQLGTVNNNTGWIQLHSIAVIGTDHIEFSQFSGTGTYTAGAGLQLTGRAFAIDSTVATTTGSQTLTSKTIALGNNTVSGTITEFNSALTDADFATIAGTEVLTNKTLTSPIISDNIIFEGTTANEFETTLSVVDPTADRTITLPDVTGTVITTGNLADITAVGTLSSSVVFEGTTANEFELTLGAGDPTADQTISFPDASGILVVDTAQQTLTNKTLTSPQISNLIITDGSLVIEGTTPNEFETTVTFTDPTADRVISFPDVTGTVVTTGDTGSVTSTMILDGTIVDADINASAAIAQSKISGLTTDLSNKQDKVSGVSDTEIGYLDGVTSSIQTQINGKLSLSGGTLTGALTLPGAPTENLHAATKAYVDSVVEGLHVHESARAATTANIDLSTDLENGDVLDGVTLVTGDRVLVKNQTTQSQNGIYVVQASGAAVRATDFDTAAEVDSGDFIFVQSGTVNAGSGWVQTNKPATIGTDPIAFTQFAGAGTFSAGNGLTLTGSTFSINTSITADLSSAQTLTNKTLTSPVINLGLNSQTGTSYTFTLADNGRFVTANNSSPITVTIPPASSVNYPIGAQLNIVQKGTGQVTFAQGSGVTILSTGATSTAPKLRVRYSSATAIYEGSDTWYVVGDIA